MARYQDVLPAVTHSVIERTQKLSQRSIRLLARLVTRRGEWLRTDRLDYAEVDSIPWALQELHNADLIRICDSIPSECLLRLLTVAELRDEFTDLPAGVRKPELIACLGAALPPTHLQVRLRRRFEWLHVRCVTQINQCARLYFGASNQDLSAFVLRDLGMVRHPTYQIEKSAREFESAEEIDAYFALRDVREQFEMLEEAPEQARLILATIRKPVSNRSVRRLRSRLALKLGRWHERRGENDEALRCFALSDAPPARERMARIHKRRNDGEALRATLDAIVNAPLCATEERFAQRFISRPPRSRPPTDEYDLDAHPVSIERHAIAELNAAGAQAWHVENSLPLGLAGIIYWHAVFAPVRGAFTHPFQTRPNDLFWPDFAAERVDEIDEVTSKNISNNLVTNCFIYRNISNSLVSWRLFLPSFARLIAARMPNTALYRLARWTIHNLTDARTGFPDLFVVWPSGEIAFVEVKGPTDQLQPAQRLWLARLEDMGFNASVRKYRPPA